MRIAQIRSMDISNGPGIGVSLFFQGCPYHCPGCFNASTWDLLGGKEVSSERDLQRRITKLLSQEYITRFSVLGGEPLMPQNMKFLNQLVRVIPPHIQVWCWTGTTLENLMALIEGRQDDCTDIPLLNMCWDSDTIRYLSLFLHEIDFLVDGRFDLKKKDLTLKWRGSSNQRVIHLPSYLSTGIIRTYDNDSLSNL